MEEQEPDKQFIEAFNNGYLLAKYEPELAAKITGQENGHSEYFKALELGKKEYETEQMREWARSFSRGSSGRDDREQEKER